MSLDANRSELEFSPLQPDETGQSGQLKRSEVSKELSQNKRTKTVDLSTSAKPSVVTGSDAVLDRAGVHLRNFLKDIKAELHAQTTNQGQQESVIEELRQQLADKEKRLVDGERAKRAAEASLAEANRTTESTQALLDEANRITESTQAVLADAQMEIAVLENTVKIAEWEDVASHRSIASIMRQKKVLEDKLNAMKKAKEVASERLERIAQLAQVKQPE